MHEIYNCRSRIGNGLALHLTQCCCHHHTGCPSTMAACRNRMPQAMNHKPDEPRKVQEDHQIIRLSGASPDRIRVCLLRTRADGRREKAHFPTCHRLLSLSPGHGAAAGHVVALQLFRGPLRLVLAPFSAAGRPGPYRGVRYYTRRPQAPLRFAATSISILSFASSSSSLLPLLLPATLSLSPSAILSSFYLPFFLCLLYRLLVSFFGSLLSFSSFFLCLFSFLRRSLCRTFQSIKPSFPPTSTSPLPSLLIIGLSPLSSSRSSPSTRLVQVLGCYLPS